MDKNRFLYFIFKDLLTSVTCAKSAYGIKGKTRNIMMMMMTMVVILMIDLAAV